jgi:hypothetical protein
LKLEIAEPIAESFGLDSRVLPRADYKGSGG